MPIVPARTPSIKARFKSSFFISSERPDRPFFTAGAGMGRIDDSRLDFFFLDFFLDIVRSALRVEFLSELRFPICCFKYIRIIASHSHRTFVHQREPPEVSRKCIGEEDEIVLSIKPCINAATTSTCRPSSTAILQLPISRYPAVLGMVRTVALVMRR